MHAISAPIDDQQVNVDFFCCLPQAWLDFAKENYPYVVDCKGMSGKYVAVRLLNTGRTEKEETNFLDNAPMTLCEIEVEEKK